MAIAVVCETYHWTYQEYLEQPKWFIELIHRKLDIDAKRQNQLMKKHAK